MKIGTTILVLFSVCLLALSMTPSAKADCHASIVATVWPTDMHTSPKSPGTLINPTFLASPPILNQEGLAERGADILIWDDGTDTLPAHNNCFSDTHNVFTLTFNVPFSKVASTNPAALNSTSPANVDIYDSAGASGLSLSSVATTTTTVMGGKMVDTVTITLAQIGTPGDPTLTTTGAALRLKNLRYDVVDYLMPGQYVQVTISASEGKFEDFPMVLQLGQAEPTIAYESPFVDAGDGEQDANGNLYRDASLGFTENFQGAFRTAIGAGAVVANDIATIPTSLVFSISNIPEGVTVAWPTDLYSASAPTNYLHFKNRATTSCPGLSNGASTLCVVYDTNENVSGPNSLEVDTGSPTAAPSVGGSGSDPLVAVTIADPSSWGNVFIESAFGPAPTPGCPEFFGDDCVSPLPGGPAPQYTDNVGPTPGKGSTRLILKNQEWFDINPIRTVILYPYATSLDSFDTGIAVSNTGEDCLPGVSPPTLASCAFLKDKHYGTPEIVPRPTHYHAGVLHLFFFGNNYGTTPPTPVQFEVDSSCLATVATVRGLDPSGNVQPGTDFAASLNTILGSGCAGVPAGLTGNFDGYAIVVAEFNYGHGYGITFAPSGQMTAFSALILGKDKRIGKSHREPEHLDQ